MALPRGIRTGATGALIAMAGAVAPVGAATQIVKVNAQVSKPLTLTMVQSLDLGTIALGPGNWSGATVGISRDGIFTCSNSNVTCSGPSQVATYKATGSNGATAHITAPNVTLTNQTDVSQTLTLVVDNPGAITFTNSGNKGVNFSLGGSITLGSATAPGLYSGTLNVTVDY